MGKLASQSVSAVMVILSPLALVNVRAEAGTEKAEAVRATTVAADARALRLRSFMKVFPSIYREMIESSIIIANGYSQNKLENLEVSYVDKVAGDEK